MTKLPRMRAGEFSAAKMGTVDPFAPIPIPSRRRVMKSSFQVWVKAPPMTGKKQKIAEKKMVPRRPNQLFNGSESQQPLIIFLRRLEID